MPPPPRMALHSCVRLSRCCCRPPPFAGEHFPDVFTRLVNAQRKRDYPLACAGINVTFLLLEMLRLTDDVCILCRMHALERRSTSLSHRQID